MYQGFYTLTSGMLTQSRNLNVISNNMVNIQTAGYKRDKMTSSTFEEEMLYRTGRHNKENQTEMGLPQRFGLHKRHMSTMSRAALRRPVASMILP